MNKQYSVKLKIFKGRKSYDEKGNMISPNQSVEITPFGGLEWNNYLANISLLGYTGAEVTEVTEISYNKVQDNTKKEGEMKIETTYKVVEASKDILEAVKNAFNKKVEKALTPEQKELADLKAEMKEMREAMKSGSKTPAKKVEDNTPNINEELDAARDKYTKLYEKKPHHLWKLEKINSFIAEKEKV